VLLCVLLVEFTAQVDAYGSIGSRTTNRRFARETVSTRLQQLVAPIAYTGRFGGADSGRFDVSRLKSSRRTAGCKGIPT